MPLTPVVLLAALAVFASGASVYSHDTPGPANNLGREKLGGIKGRIAYESLLQGDGLEGWQAHASPNFPEGAWTRDGDTIIGQVGHDKYGRITVGDANWRSYDFSVKATLIEGSNIQIAFRVQEDDQSFYLLDFLTGWRALSVTKKEAGVPGVTKLDVINFPIEKGREYDIEIAVLDESIITYVDGEMINRLTYGRFQKGKVGFLMWHATHVRFRDPKIRVYN